MRSDQVEKEMKQYVPAEADPDDYLPVHDGDDVVGAIPWKDVEGIGDSWDGAWIGCEKLVGIAPFEGTRIVVVNDGDYDYARADYTLSPEEEEKLRNGELVWDPINCHLQEPDYDEEEPDYDETEG